jgi:hypothetical protein
MCNELLVQVVKGLADAGVDFEVNSQVLDGARWNEVVMNQQRLILMVYQSDVVVYNWTGPDCEVDLYSATPVAELEGDRLAAWLSGWHPDGDCGGATGVPPCPAT